MIIRKCSQGHRVRIHRNTSPGVSRTKKYKNGTVETITYPSAYDYFIDAIKEKDIVIGNQNGKNPNGKSQKWGDVFSKEFEKIADPKKMIKPH